MNASIVIENAHNVLLMAEDTNEEVQVDIYCQYLYLWYNYMLSFSNSSNVTIDGLSFVLHPQNGTNFVELLLHFYNISGLYFKDSNARSTNGSWPCSVAVIESQHVEIGSLTIYYGRIYLFDIENIHITAVPTAYDQCNNISTLRSAYIGIILDSVNNITIQNIVLKPNDAPKIGMGMGVKVTKSYNVTIAETTVSSSTNPYPHFLTILDIKRQPAVIELHDSNVTVVNCTFSHNNITALRLVRTHLKVLGNLTFTGNRAYKGAAMIIIESYIILTEMCYITFTDNFADETGGAIYIVPETVYLRPPYAFNRFQSLLASIRYLSTTTKCFLTVEGDRKNQLIFINNTARQGGDVLYGGSLGSACETIDWKTCGKCLEDFNSSSLVIPKTLSAISSDPTRVCFCDNSNTPDCLTVSHAASPIYPGQNVTVSMVVEGHSLGTVVGSVFAQFLANEKSLHLKAGQYIQEAQQHECNQVNYTILPGNEETHAVLILTAKKINPTQPQHRSEDIESKIIKQFREGHRLFLKYIQEFSVFLNITLLPCPPGFAFSQKSSKCDCNKNLQHLQKVTCDIQRQEVQRRGLVWVGPFMDGNNTIINVMTAHNCPLNYCKYETVNITLNQSEKQCNYNHSGTLCGGCQPGLSLALGSAQCLKCSNKYLALLIPLTLAGLVLVLFIKILDLTISQGFINGLIFYANILQPNLHIFLPQMTAINPLTLFIAWLNLDLGIETCFVDGLTAYWKTWLQFVFPFYIWAIAGLIIISARYSTRLARVMGNNSVPVLATLFLLSYAKLLRTIITIMSYTVVDTPHGQKTVWSADGNIDYLGPQHAPLFVAGIATLLFLWLPYTLLLLLGQWIRKINHQHVTHMLMKVKPFLDAHYGPLKDKHHYWFGVLLCVRVIILLISAVVPANNFSIFTLSMSITAGALISFTSIGPAVYHNNIVSTFEIFLFTNLGLLGLAKFYTYAAGGDQAAATYTLIGVAFTQYLGLILYQIYSLLKPLFSHYHTHDDDDDEAAEGIWRYNTSMQLWNVPHRATPYHDAATAL